MSTQLQELIFSLAGADCSKRQRERMKKLLADENLDRRKWLSLARHYQLSPLLYANLKQLDLLEQIPAPTRRLLKEDYLQTNSLNLAYYHELKQVRRMLEAAGVPSLVLKGAALLPLVYGQLGRRSFADIDLLIRPAHLERARAVLERRYRVQTPLPRDSRRRRCYFHLAFRRREAPHLSLELHWALFSPTTPLELDIECFWRQAQEIEVKAADCRFPAPRREFLLLHQCLHFSGHYFLSWRDLVDIAWLLRPAQPPLDWELLLAPVRKYSLQSRLYYPLLWAGRFLQAAVPLPLLEALEPPLPRQQLFQQMLRREGGLLNEPAARNQDLRVVMDLLLLAPYQALGFFRRLCWPGIAWLSIFPEQAPKPWPLETIRVLLRGLRLIVYGCCYLLSV